MVIPRVTEIKNLHPCPKMEEKLTWKNHSTQILKHASIKMVITIVNKYSEYMKNENQHPFFSGKKIPSDSSECQKLVYIDHSSTLSP